MSPTYDEIDDPPLGYAANLNSDSTRALYEAPSRRQSELYDDGLVPGTMLTMHLKPRLYEEPSTRQSQLYDDGEVPGAAGHFVQTGEDYASLENALQTYGSSTAAGGSSAQVQGEYALYEDFDENGNCGSSTADSQAQDAHAFLDMLYEDFDENDSDLDV